jgi:hypothetical protein
VEELAEVVVAGVQMARVEASHYCSAMGIEPGLRLLGLTVNFGSRASYRHCVAGPTT